MGRTWLCISVAGVALAAASGCATQQVGKAFDYEKAAAFREGISTRQEVEATLGQPSTISTGSSGETILIYQHIVGHGNGLTGKATATGQTVVYTFGADSVLQRKTMTATGM